MALSPGTDKASAPKASTHVDHGTAEAITFPIEARLRHVQTNYPP
jgi:hypothetical protein